MKQITDIQIAAVMRQAKYYAKAVIEYKKEYDEIKTIYEQNKDIFSKDANAYLKDKMNSYEKNIKYYTDILELIEREVK